MEKIILVIDDVKEIGKTIEMLMEGKDCKIIKKYNGLSGIQAINEKVDLIISDIKMPGVDGFEVLKYAKEKFLGIPVIIITGFGDIAIAVKAIKNGAYDFITKPFHIDEIENKINRALNVNWREQSNKENKNQTLIIGKNEKIIKILDFIDTIHDTDSIVIIYGESGTGKELIAKRIHESSRRKNENFVAVNCAAIPFDLLESELFGYEKGAFTGANTLKQGLFEIADNGTIFLDEIGDIHPLLQAKLLRILQDGQFYRVGGTKPCKVNTRIIAATNRNLQEMVLKKEFREDLYYRINILPIYLPPVRERKEDIEELTQYFLNKLCIKYNKTITLSQELMQLFIEYKWPGNVRELQNVIERIFLINRDKSTITSKDLPLDVLLESSISNNYATTGDLNYKRLKKKIVWEFDTLYLTRLLKQTNGNISKAARISGIERKNLNVKIKKASLDINTFRI